MNEQDQDKTPLNFKTDTWRAQLAKVLEAKLKQSNNTKLMEFLLDKAIKESISKEMIIEIVGYDPYQQDKPNDPPRESVTARQTKEKDATPRLKKTA